MTQRPLLLALIFLGGSIAYAPPALAQRSGFIIGFGLGPGLVLYSSVPDRESKIGMALDFHIGGVIGDSFELYYVHKGTLFRTDEVGVDFIGLGMNGLGFAYPLNPEFTINGGIGMGRRDRLRGGNVDSDESGGLGLVGGVRYKLSESGRWGLCFDITYGRPSPGFNTLGAQFTISVLSH